MIKKASLYSSLLKRIEESQPNSKFLSENQICSIFSVSRITARNVIQELEKRNYLSSKRGSGYYINHKDLWNIGESWTKKNGQRSNIVYKKSMKLNPFFNKYKSLKASDFESYIKIKKSGSRISLVSYNWLNIDKIKLAKIEDIENSLIDFLKNQDSFDYSFNTIKIEKAPVSVCELLNIGRNALIPKKYTFIQNKNLEFIHCSVEYWLPKYFQANFTQNL